MDANHWRKPHPTGKPVYRSPDSRFENAEVAKAPFYTNGDIVRVSNGKKSAFMVAAGTGDLGSRSFYPLNGTVEDMFRANQAAGLNITEENAIEYLRFFHEHLRTQSGERFEIIESLGGFCLMDERGRHRPKPADMRLVYAGSFTDQDFAFRGYVTYEGCLWAVRTLVRTSGAVEMMDDEPQGIIVRAH